MKRFFGFSVLSGIGWIFDFLIFSVLVKLLGLAPLPANLISSYSGATFVWFTSLRLIFERRGKGRQWLIVVFWCFQFASILIYSKALSLVADVISRLEIFAMLVSVAALVAKIAITPVNLMTNFIFMRTITKFMGK